VAAHAAAPTTIAPTPALLRAINRAGETRPDASPRGPATAALPYVTNADRIGLQQGSEAFLVPGYVPSSNVKLPSGCAKLVVGAASQSSSAAATIVTRSTITPRAQLPVLIGALHLSAHEPVMRM